MPISRLMLVLIFSWVTMVLEDGTTCIWMASMREKLNALDTILPILAIS